MANFFLDNDDLRYYFEKGIDWAPIVKLTELGFRSEGGPKTVEEAVELYRDIVQMIGEFVADEVAPHVAQIEREGVRFENGEASFPPRLAAIFKKVQELDLHRLNMPRELNGTNAPMFLYLVQSELFARADASVSNHVGFFGGIAIALLLYSIQEGSTKFDPETLKITDVRFAKEIEEISSGKAWGCMDITEANAGSDMAALRTIGEQDEHGNWFVTGEKVFITSGHGKYHIVIARTEKAKAGEDALAGLSGLSLFLVKTYEDQPDGTRVRYAELARIEEKLGHHASVTGTVVFDRSPALLIGQRGEGFKYMLFLMNNARLGVGFESIGLCEAAYRLAADYAAQRPSMGKMIDRHEMIADYLEEMRTDIQGVRALAMFGALHQELGEREAISLRFAPPTDALAKKRLERSVRRHRAHSRRITPLLKYLAAEAAVTAGRRCVQIHGGNGFMKEYAAEKLLRDSIVLPIYEGTSQIQALMAMKDTLGAIMKNPREFVARIAQARWRALSARDPLERRVARIVSLSLGAQQHLMTRTATDKFRSLHGRPLAEWPTAFLKNWNPKRDFAFAMLHAERLTRLLADEAICEVLLEQAKKHPERAEVLERYLERAEPRCRFLADEIATTGTRLLKKLGALPEDDERAAGDGAEAAGKDGEQAVG